MNTINEVASLRIEGDIATLTIDSPPVNALSHSVRKGLFDGLTAANADAEVRGIVLICAGRTFFAGADISEFDAPPVQPDLGAIQSLLEAGDKPVVAAIHGTALGGGFEVALTCHFRVAVPSAKVGLPEVLLGLLPGAGGTQRLPRIVGARAALDIIVSGKPLTARAAIDLGLLDQLVADDLHTGAIAFLRDVIDRKLPLARVRDREDMLAEGRENPGLFDEYRIANARSFKGFKAPEAIVKAIEAAVSLPFDAGLKREWELFETLVDSTQSQAQRYSFFAERQVSKVPDVPSSTPTRPVARVGVIGAGTMGGGIAMNFLNIDLPVVISEQNQEALDRGVATIRRNYETTVKRGRLSSETMESRMALLSPSIGFEPLADCDLIIEAVFENIDLKKKIFLELDALAKPEAILASNTSFLDLDAIAAVTSHPDRVVGMHFFSPANVMRLLEVVRGKETAKDVVASAMQIGRKIGKIAVLSRVCDGFIANRIMDQRARAADDLILEGPMPWDLDRVMLDFGFPMGPFGMLDLIGVDVIGWDAKTTSSSTVREVLCETGRWGQKRGAGFYDYDDKRRATPSKVTEEIVTGFSVKKGITRRLFTDQEIIERLLFPVVNEASKTLEEGIALRASDIDVAIMNGYAWPVYTGGPLFWADTIGLAKVANVLNKLAETNGPGYAPSRLITSMADEGRLFRNG